MYWNHKIDRFEFQFWEGDCPHLPRQTSQSFTRAGADGTGFRLLGTRAPVTECQLTAHLARYSLRTALVREYLKLIGENPLEVWFNKTRLFQTDKVKFVIEDVKEIECRTNVRLIGPGYNLPGGAALVTRWRMVAVAV